MNSFIETYNAFLKGENGNLAYLMNTQRIKKFNHPEVQAVLNACYKPDRSLSPITKLNSKLFGTLLNAIFLQGRFVFITTKRDFEKLLSEDANTKRRTLSFEDFKRFTKFIHTNSYIGVIQKPVTTGKNKAGCYYLKNEQLRTLLGQFVAFTIEESQRQQCLEILNKNDEK